MKQFGRNYPKKERKKEDEAFAEVKIFLPKSLHFMLKAKSDKDRIPVSKLITIAVDNEMDVDTPFYYPAIVPTTPYVESAYVDEAGKLYSFLEKVEYGIGLEHLLLCRRDIGIEDKSTLLLAYRELLKNDLVEEFYPDRSAFTHPINYRYIRLKIKAPKEINKNKTREMKNEL